MHNPSSDVAFTPAVKAAQSRLGSRSQYEQVERGDGWTNVITPMLKSFIAERDSFYFGTASADAQPYIQHRGGPPGFLHVLDDKTLAFADFLGNRQYISVGNLSENPKVIIFMMDYPNQRRVKIWGSADYVEDDPALLEKLMPPDYHAKPQRVIRFHVAAWDISCKSHIQPRYTPEQLAPTFASGSVFGSPDVVNIPSVIVVVSVFSSSAFFGASGFSGVSVFGGESANAVSGSPPPLLVGLGSSHFDTTMLPPEIEIVLLSSLIVPASLRMDCGIDADDTDTTSPLFPMVPATRKSSPATGNSCFTATYGRGR